MGVADALTHDEQEAAALRKALLWFDTADGKRVLEHFETTCFARRTPMSYVNGHGSDDALTTFNLGRQSVVFDLWLWIRTAREGVPEPQRVATGTLSEEA